MIRRFHAASLALAALLTPVPALAQGLDFPYEKFVLDNGLEVVLHEDRSDPIVAVYVSYHVGSAREERGRSGFAHLFEHMLFQGSKNVGDDQHFKLITEAGGTLNGTTNLDRTLYFETLPSNHLELALWLEADRMGFLLPAVTQEKLDNQRDVVKNERRQNYENRPYAQAAGVLAAAMYPEDHPYSWTTIGSMADLSAASLEDVHAFFRRFYGPNNATLAIGGDIDLTRTKELVRKYFGGIPRGPEVEKPAPRPVILTTVKRSVLEDAVQLPQLVLSWPAVSQGSEDDAALDLLAAVLSQGKASLLERHLRIDAALARSVSARNAANELAGEFTITVTAAPGASLEALEVKIHGILERLAKEGVTESQLAKAKAMLESQALRRFETVSGKTASLAVSNMFYGDPNRAARDLEKRLSTTPKEVTSALTRWIVGKPFVVVSVVPKGKIELAASGRTESQIEIERALDRSARPAPEPRPGVKTISLWREELPGGIPVVGTPYTEIPWTILQISFPAGRLRESLDKLGWTTLAAEVLGEGSASRSSVELAEAFESLGATFSVSASDDSFTYQLSCPNPRLEAAASLFAEVLLTPRLDVKDFERKKRERLVAIDTRGENAAGTANRVWDRLTFGEATAAGFPAEGTRATVEALTLEDVRAFHAQTVRPDGAHVEFVGALDASGLRRLLAPILGAWSTASVKGARVKPVDASADAPAPVAKPGEPRVFLVNKPGAAQSEVRIGHLGVSAVDPDYYPLTVLNYVLGGAFTSRINMNLREQKGYTYGARSAFTGRARPGPFTASGGIHTQHTAAAIVEFLAEIRGIREGVREDELKFAKDALAQNAALRFETAAARMSHLTDLVELGLPEDYRERRLAQLDALRTEDLTRLAASQLHPDRMRVLVVGDKAKVKADLESLGLGPVVELDIDGNVQSSK